MKRIVMIALFSALVGLGTLGTHSPAIGHGAAKSTETKGHNDHNDHNDHMGGGMMPRDLDEMRKLHQGHEHGHDFQAMRELTGPQQTRLMALMHEIGVAMPPMDPRRGRELFAQKGCVACHAVNNVGGTLGPALNASEMARPMNVFDFAARMWRGAPAMAALQEDMLGEIIALDGQDLADLIAFAHDAKEQKRFSSDQIPKKFQALVQNK